MPESGPIPDLEETLRLELDAELMNWARHRIDTDERAERLARDLAALRGTTLGVEWESALDRYQRWVVHGDV